MRRLLKTFTDPKLARKMALLRAFFLVMGLAAIALVIFAASSGELLSRGSLTGGRFISDGELLTIYWSASPLVYVLIVVWYVLISLAVLGSFYIALARLPEKWHGRRSRFFQRKYPH